MRASPQVPQHAAFIRATHWLIAIATIGLIVSGVAILLAHPRLYWGETGAVGTPALIDLPIPFLLGHSGWGRYLHFVSAWASVVIGIVYVFYGLLTQHFYRGLVPSRADLAWPHLRRVVADHVRLTPARSTERHSYNVLQRLAYATLVFVVGPLVVLSGLAFSPALTSVIPTLVYMFGGQQSARTVHFFGAAAVVLFIVVHVVMVWLTGFRAQTRAMITGDSASSPEDS